MASLCRNELIGIPDTLISMAPGATPQDIVTGYFASAREGATSPHGKNGGDGTAVSAGVPTARSTEP